MRLSFRCCACALVLLGFLTLSCGARDGSAATAAQVPATAPEAAGEPSNIEPLPRRAATLYFPSSNTGLLVAESREILATPNPEDRAKQILSDLLTGPTQPGLDGAVPKGTKLLQVYVLQDGTAYADFSAELQSAIEPGSDAEILTVYAIVNSLTINIPEIDRVGILVGGRLAPSLNGHLDLRRPLQPNWKVVEDSGQAHDNVI